MHRRYAFSLLEVSVLLGLTAVAAALIFTVFQRKNGEKQATCASNMREVGLALMLYAQDWDDRLAPVNVPATGVTSAPGNGFVFSLLPYIKSSDLFQCPSEPNSTPGKTDFAYNVAVAGQEEKKIRNPSSTVLFCETDESAGSMASASAPLVTDRHKGGSNYCFQDGHVKWLESSKAPAPSNVPATKGNFTFGR